MHWTGGIHSHFRGFQLRVFLLPSVVYSPPPARKVSRPADYPSNQDAEAVHRRFNPYRP